MYGGVADYDFVAGDTNSVLLVTCKRADNGAIIDLTGISPKLKYKIDTGTLQSKDMTVTTATQGLCSYNFATGELVAGIMAAEVELWSGGKLITSLELKRFSVREKLA